MGCRSFQQTSRCEANPWRVVPLLQVHSSRRGDNNKTSNWTLSPYFYRLLHFIFILLLFNGRISSLGSILFHWRLNLFNGSVLIPLEAHTFPSKTLEQVGTPNRSISCFIHKQNNNVPFFFI